jgi:hypothetical protein
MVRANEMRKAEISGDVVRDGCRTGVYWSHPRAVWTWRMETPCGSLVDQLATHDRSRCSGELCDVPGHSSLAAAEPREKGQSRAAHRMPPSCHDRSGTRLS